MCYKGETTGETKLTIIISGNQCRALLKSLHKLNIPDSFQEFTDVLYALRNLHHLCNQQFLPHNYPKVIDEFREKWYKLTEEYDVTTSPKIHILLDHLEDYFDVTSTTLIKTTDELVENMHQYLHKRLIKSFYLVNDVTNPSQGARLFRAVPHLNSYKMSIVKK